MRPIEPTDNREDFPRSPWTLSEAAKRLGVSPKTLERRIKKKEIKVIKFGRLVRIPDAEVRRLASDGCTHPDSA